VGEFLQLEKYIIKCENHFLDTPPADLWRYEINNSPHRHRCHILVAMLHHLDGLNHSLDKTSGSHTPPHDLFFLLLLPAVDETVKVNKNISGAYGEEERNFGR
jgi:hypothetical protein